MSARQPGSDNADSGSSRIHSPCISVRDLARGINGYEVVPFGNAGEEIVFKT